MLLEKITNPCTKFEILDILNVSNEEKTEVAKKAFLFLLKSKVGKLIEKIVKKYPNIVNIITDEEILEPLRDYIKIFGNYDKYSILEMLIFITTFFKNPETIKKIEKMFYRSYITVPPYDEPIDTLGDRYKYYWLLSKNEKSVIIRDVIKKYTGHQDAIFFAKHFKMPTKKLYQALSEKEKIEITEEIIKEHPNNWEKKIKNKFGEETNTIIKKYYKQLISGTYPKTEEIKALGKNYPDIIWEILIEETNKGNFYHAYEFTKRFLPEEKEIFEELNTVLEFLKTTK